MSFESRKRTFALSSKVVTFFSAAGRSRGGAAEDDFYCVGFPAPRPAGQGCGLDCPWGRRVAAFLDGWLVFAVGWSILQAVDAPPDDFLLSASHPRYPAVARSDSSIYSYLSLFLFPVFRFKFWHFPSNSIITKFQSLCNSRSWGAKKASALEVSNLDRSKTDDSYQGAVDKNQPSPLAEPI